MEDDLNLEELDLVFQAEILVAEDAEDEMSSDSSESGIVYGTALPYDIAGHFPNAPHPVKVRAGAATKHLMRRARLADRDVELRAAHGEHETLARVSEGSLEFEDGPRELTYRATLDFKDKDAERAYGKVKARNWKMASAGFRVLKAKKVQEIDNSPESKTGNEPTTIIAATEIDIYEVSLLNKGAFVGSTAFAAKHASDDAMLIEGADGESDTVMYELDGAWWEAKQMASPPDAVVNAAETSADEADNTPADEAEDVAETSFEAAEEADNESPESALESDSSASDASEDVCLSASEDHTGSRHSGPKRTLGDIRKELAERQIRVTRS